MNDSIYKRLGVNTGTIDTSAHVFQQRRTADLQLRPSATTKNHIERSSQGIESPGTAAEGPRNDRLERKRNREKFRRNQIKNSFDHLIPVLLKVDRDFRDHFLDRLRRQHFTKTGKDELPPNKQKIPTNIEEMSDEISCLFSRHELLEHASSALERLHGRTNCIHGSGVVNSTGRYDAGSFRNDDTQEPRVITTTCDHNLEGGTEILDGGHQNLCHDLLRSSSGHHEAGISPHINPFHQQPTLKEEQCQLVGQSLPQVRFSDFLQDHQAASRMFETRHNSLRGTTDSLSQPGRYQDRVSQNRLKSNQDLDLDQDQDQAQATLFAALQASLSTSTFMHQPRPAPR